jgi:hypothetical protein
MNLTVFKEKHRLASYTMELGSWDEMVRRLDDMKPHDSGEEAVEDKKIPVCENWSTLLDDPDERDFGDGDFGDGDFGDDEPEEIEINLSKSYVSKEISDELKQTSWNDLLKPDIQEIESFLRWGPVVNDAIFDYVSGHLPVYYDWCVSRKDDFKVEHDKAFGCTINLTTGEIKMHRHIVDFIEEHDKRNDATN